MFWVYILENVGGRFYVDHTDDLQQRFDQHNDPAREKSKYTAKHGPWKLVWSEEHPDRSSVVKRERFIESRKSAA
ncbi:GIY-YIG nuclease family protein [bacterium]|nr:GIY-YIG nuclease family protein [bacterium]